MNYYLTLAIILFLYMNLWFVVAVIKKRNDVADVAWGLGFVLLAWVSFFLSGAAASRGILVNILVSIWGLRLAWHIHGRNKGKLMQQGLWAYTRHPNYFGEVALWWGIWLLSLSVPGSWFAIIGPVTITLLILQVSGIPMLEQKMAAHQDFAAYKRRVSSFFPLPPRRRS